MDNAKVKKEDSKKSKNEILQEKIFLNKKSSWHFYSEDQKKEIFRENSGGLHLGNSRQ